MNCKRKLTVENHPSKRVKYNKTEEGVLIPKEVLQLIFNYLNIIQTTSLRLVCKLFNEMIVEMNYETLNFINISKEHRELIIMLILDNKESLKNLTLPWFDKLKYYIPAISSCVNLKCLISRDHHTGLSKLKEVNKSIETVTTFTNKLDYFNRDSCLYNFCFPNLKEVKVLYYFENQPSDNPSKITYLAKECEYRGYGSVDDCVTYYTEKILKFMIGKLGFRIKGNKHNSSIMWTETLINKQPNYKYCELLVNHGLSFDHISMDDWFELFINRITFRSVPILFNLSKTDDASDVISNRKLYYLSEYIIERLLKEYKSKIYNYQSMIILFNSMCKLFIPKCRWFIVKHYRIDVKEMEDKLCLVDGI